MPGNGRCNGSSSFESIPLGALESGQSMCSGARWVLRKPLSVKLSVTVSPSPQSKIEENEKLHELQRYARDFRHQHTTDAKRFNWDSDDEDYGLAIGCLVVT
jgi:hypothetical protein